VAGAAESLFLLHERGTSALREVRGGVVISFVAIRLVRGRLREVHPQMIALALLFVAYFALGPIEQWLGVR
jgi:xanthine/uracil/vitamin C permease (AzgA family)